MKNRMMRWLEVVSLRIVVAVIQVLPLETCGRICEFLAWLSTDVLKFRRRVIHENIRGVFPEADEARCRELTREMWYHLFLMACEVAHAPRMMHDTNWKQYLDIRDQATITGYLIDYRPLIAVSGHFGNFEMAGYMTGMMGMPSYTVARTLDNPALDQFLNQFRSRYGQFILPKDGSANLVQDAVNRGAIMGLLGDQHAGTKGCWVDFLGRPASCHKAVALFTLSGNAPMMVSYCKHNGRPMHFEIGCTGVVDPREMPAELKDVTSLTQWYNERLGEAILADPGQYWWVHRRWKDKPQRKTRKRRATQAA